MNEVIEIKTEHIRLDSFLKLAALVVSGGEAKTFIQSGEVSVNGEICTQRTKKLRDGDKVVFDEKNLLVRGGTE